MCRVQDGLTKPTMSARNHTQQHGQTKQFQELAAMESLLDRLGASTCRCSDWAQEKERTTAFMAWIKGVQYASTWPPWLVPKLTAAIKVPVGRRRPGGLWG